MSFEQEKEGLVKIIEGMRSRGWQPTQVFDGEEYIALEPGQDAASIVEECSSTDDSTLIFNGISPSRRGSLYLVWGNSPSELVADNSIGHGFDVDLDETLRDVFPGWPNCED
ncbi:hypothetical protein D3C86_1217210 [compost metagenome]